MTTMTCPLCKSIIGDGGKCTGERCTFSILVERGFYQHWKGGIYYVHGEARNDDTQEHIIVYSSVRGNEDGLLRYRTLREFTEVVGLERRVQRFTRMR